MNRAVLDVNVLIALLDASHAFNSTAHEWWAANFHHGWASCPLTENGFARVMINPSYSRSRRFTLEEVIGALSTFTGGTNHEFWPDTLTFRDSKTFATNRIHGSSQLTDLYLLALATRHGGRLVTFDQKISISAVKKAIPDNLCIL